MFALLALATACNGGVDMQPLVDDFNKQCPVLLLEEGNMQTTSATLTDKVLVINNEIQEAIGDSIAQDVKMINAIGDEALKRLCLASLQDNAAFKALMQACHDNGIEVKVNFVEKQNDITKNIDIPAAEVKSAAEGSLNLDPKVVQLQLVVNAANGMFPMSEQGIVLNGVTLDDSDVVISCTVDDRKVPMSAISSNVAAIKKQMNPKTNKDLKKITEMCVAANRGFKFVFIGDKSDKRVEMAFTVDELK